VISLGLIIVAAMAILVIGAIVALVVIGNPPPIGFQLRGRQIGDMASAPARRLWLPLWSWTRNSAWALE